MTSILLNFEGKEEKNFHRLLRIKNSIKAHTRHAITWEEFFLILALKRDIMSPQAFLEASDRYVARLTDTSNKRRLKKDGKLNNTK